MSSQLTPYSAIPSTFSPTPSSNAEPQNSNQAAPATPVGRGRPRGGQIGTSAKRGRKPRGGAAIGTSSPGALHSNLGTPTPLSANTHVHWAMPSAGGTSSIVSTSMPTAATSGNNNNNGAVLQGNNATNPTAAVTTPTPSSAEQLQQPQPSQQVSYSIQPSTSTPRNLTNYSIPSGSTIPTLDTTGLISLSGSNPPVLPVGLAPPARPAGIDEDGEGEDELLPAMADDDYSAQLSWQSQSKDNLKVLMDNFSEAQYERFEAYRRHALPKQAVRKVIQQTLGQQVSQPVAQIVAGFAKVFVGEIIEKARAVQTRRRETGPLSPDHLREAYRLYQEETGRVGAARPLKSKRLFVR